MSNTNEDLFGNGSVTVEGLTKEYGIGRTKAYMLMAQGLLPYTQLGTRRLIPRAAIARLLAARMSELSGPEEPRDGRLAGASG